MIFLKWFLIFGYGNYNYLTFIIIPFYNFYKVLSGFKVCQSLFMFLRRPTTCLEAIIKLILPFKCKLYYLT